MQTTQVMNLRLKALNAWNARVSGLIDDGYTVAFKSCGISDDMWFVSLRHRNGNRVSMTAYWRRNQLIQRTNGLISHEGTLY